MQEQQRLKHISNYADYDITYSVTYYAEF